VEIVAISLKTDPAKVFTNKSLISLSGYDMTDLAAKDVYERSKVKPSEIGVCELHDCFSANELVTYEGL
jgi:sterol carrier protein 2